MRAVREHKQGQLFAICPAALHQLTGCFFCLHVQHLIRNGIACEEITNLREVRRPTMADDPNSFKRRTERCLPIVEQIVHDAVETLLRRIPRLHQIMIDLH